MNKLKIIIAEDQTMMRESLTFMLEQEQGIEQVLQAENGQEVLSLLENHKVDLILMDYRMPVMNGYEASKIIKVQFPLVKILFLTMHNEYQYTKELMELGVDGIVLKDAGKVNLLHAIDKVMSDEKFFDPDVMSAYLEGVQKTNSGENGSKIDKLSDRERQIMIGICEGKTHEVIADEMNIASITVKTHRKNIYRKTGVNSLQELIVLAIKQGLIEIDD